MADDLKNKPASSEAAAEVEAAAAARADKAKNNLKFTVSAYDEEIAFADAVALRFDVEKSNLFRRAFRKYVEEELGIEVPDHLFTDRSKGNHNAPPPAFIGSRWKGHTSKAKVKKPKAPASASGYKLVERERD